MAASVDKYVTDDGEQTFLVGEADGDYRLVVVHTKSYDNERAKVTSDDESFLDDLMIMRLNERGAPMGRRTGSILGVVLALESAGYKVSGHNPYITTENEAGEIR